MPVLPKAKGMAVRLLSTTACRFFAMFGICNTEPKSGFRGAGEKGDSTPAARCPLPPRPTEGHTGAQPTGHRAHGCDRNED